MGFTMENEFQSIFSNNIQVSQSSSQKHLGFILDEKLTFCERKLTKR